MANKIDEIEINNEEGEERELADSEDDIEDYDEEDCEQDEYEEENEVCSKQPENSGIKYRQEMVKHMGNGWKSGSGSGKVPSAGMRAKSEKKFVFAGEYARTGSELRQSDWAKRFGVSVRTIQNWLNDDDVKRRIVKVQNTPVKFDANTISIMSREERDHLKELLEQQEKIDEDDPDGIILVLRKKLEDFTELLERDTFITQVERVLIEYSEKITNEDIRIQLENMALVIDLYESKGYDFGES